MTTPQHMTAQDMTDNLRDDNNQAHTTTGKNFILNATSTTFQYRIDDAKEHTAAKDGKD